MLERAVDRIPALLLLLPLLLLGWVALAQARAPGLLAAGAPLCLVLVLYLQAGWRGRRRGGR